MTTLLRLLGVLLITVIAGVAPGCRGSDRPERLVDGTPAEEPPIVLERAGPNAIETKVSTVAVELVPSGSPASECLASTQEHEPQGAVVMRIGVTGKSVTFRASSGRALIGCDGDSHTGEDAGGWCGRAFGRLERGRLRDPRLDLSGCLTATDEPVAFAWIEPGTTTAFVAVRQPDYVEVYRVAGGLPVRITTTSGIDLERSTASFEVMEYDGAGRLLRAYALETRVAG